MPSCVSDNAQVCWLQPPESASDSREGGIGKAVCRSRRAAGGGGRRLRKVALTSAAVGEHQEDLPNEGERVLSVSGGDSRQYGDPLSDGHARDYAARDYKTYLKTVGRAKPSSVNLTLAAIDSFYRFMGMGKPDAKREDLAGVAPGALRRRSRRSFCGRSRGAVPHAIGRGHRLRL